MKNRNIAARHGYRHLGRVPKMEKFNSLTIQRFCLQRQSEDLTPAALDLVQSWIKDVPDGWPQVQAIVNGIRGHWSWILALSHQPTIRIQLAHSYCIHTGGRIICSRPLPRWPCETRNSMARLVSGFYASPRNYDPSTKRIPLNAGDTHFGRK